jgi:hypothetical protein
MEDYFKEIIRGQVWWLTPIIPATQEQRCGGYWFKASLGKS